jgi:sarcosine oxidase subunit gamma
MADVAGTIRNRALDGKRVAHDWVEVSPIDIAARLSLRAPASSVGAVSAALGIDLPGKPRLSATSGYVTALCLGPDEWLVLERGSGNPASRLAGVDAFHSAVDVSHRNVGISVKGRGALATLSAGCPQDLSIAAFPVGTCSRTLLGKVEIVVWRSAENEFHVECWRSFADYVFGFLQDAARDAHF